MRFVIRTRIFYPFPYPPITPDPHPSFPYPLPLTPIHTSTRPHPLYQLTPLRLPRLYDIICVLSGASLRANRSRRARDQRFIKIYGHCALSLCIRATRTTERENVPSYNSFPLLPDLPLLTKKMLNFVFSDELTPFRIAF